MSKLPMPNSKNNINAAEDNTEAADLLVPSHEEESPKLNNLDKDMSNTMQVNKVISEGIKVKAKFKGYYNGSRIFPGDEFTVKKKEDLGSWMVCIDLDEERDRVKYLNSKKIKA